MYTMDIENAAGEVNQHGFHLGTDYTVAEQIVLERLSADYSIRSIALRRNGEMVHVFDFRDLYFA